MTSLSYTFNTSTETMRKKTCAKQNLVKLASILTTSNLSISIGIKEKQYVEHMASLLQHKYLTTRTDLHTSNVYHIGLYQISSEEYEAQLNSSSL